MKTPRSRARHAVLSQLFTPAVICLVALLGFAQSPQEDRAARLQADATNGARARTEGSSRRASFRDGELIVKFRSGRIVSLQQPLSISAQFGDLVQKYAVREMTSVYARLQRSVPSGARSLAVQRQRAGLESVYKLKLSGAANVFTAARDFMTLPEVEYAEPNYIYHVHGMTNDPYLQSSNSWGQGYQDLWPLMKIQAPEAWDTSTGEGIVVAVVDTGCDLTHPDLVDNIWTNTHEIEGNHLDDDGNGYVDDVHGWNFVDDDNYPQDYFGHGTHVAGTIAAMGNNGVGTVGVAYQAHVMPVKGLDDTGSGYATGLANAIVYAVESGARVINLSWGGAGFSQTLEDAIKLAHSQGAVVVASAGNDGEDISASLDYPSGSRYVITVGSSDHNDIKTDFSNFGSSLDVLAPGGDSSDSSKNYVYVNILSLRSSTIGKYGLDDEVLRVGQDYLRLSGTSMAAPHVAGLAALILQRLPTAAPEEVRQIIRRSSTDVMNPGWDLSSGYGRINALQAVNSTALGTARIFTPGDATYTGKSLQVSFAAGAADFSSYDLEYGQAEQGPWNPILSSSTPPDGQVVFSWNIEDVPDGAYVLRLNVTDKGGTRFQDRVALVLDRVSISAPSLNAAFRTGERVQFSGSVGGGGVERYAIEFQDPATGVWRSDGVELTGDGYNKIENSVLGAWDSTVAQRADFYSVRLVIKRGDIGDIVKSTQLIIDPTLHPAWPRNILKDEGVTSSMLSFPKDLTAADIDGDGRPEILWAVGRHVWAYHADGTPVAGWPQLAGPLDPYGYGTLRRSPVAADLNGDGQLEVAAVDISGYVYVWRGDGTGVPGWPKPLLDYGAAIALADINQDGVAEIIATSETPLVSVFDLSGQMLPGWPQQLSADLADYLTLSQPSVGDVDGDGRMEIVIQNKYDDMLLYVFNSDGTLHSGWPVSLATYDPSAYMAAQPVMADVNGDGRQEIVTYTSTNRVFVFSADGSLPAGWPISLTNISITGASTADITGDGVPEVLLGAKDYRNRIPVIFAYNGSGTAITGWPAKNDILPGSSFYGFYGFSSPAAADVDGDGSREVVGLGSSSPDKPYALAAFRKDGTMVLGFPKPVAKAPADSTSTPVIMDFDGDGLQEIAWLCSTGDLYLWDAEGAGRTNGFDWTMSGHDAGRTGAQPLLRSSVSYSLQAVGAIQTGTPGIGDVLRSGFAVAVPNAGAQPLEGIEVFSQRDNFGNLTSEVAVPAGRLTTKGRLFAVTSAHDNVGLAIANPNDGEANLTFSLRDAAGNAVSGPGGAPLGGTYKLGPKAQTARFIQELVVGTPAEFTGSLTFTSDLPVSALTLLMSDGGLSTMPVADLSGTDAFAGPQIFPHLADGGGYGTQIILINPADSPQSGTIQFLTESGLPLALNLDGQSRSQLNYSIAGNGVLSINTSGAGSLVSGYAVLSPDAGQRPPVATILFKTFADGLVDAAAAVPATPPALKARLLIDRAPGRTIGLAYANGTSSVADVTMRVLYQNGQPALGSDGVTLPRVRFRLYPHLKEALFAENLVPEIPANFFGLLEVSSTQPLSMITLRLSNKASGGYTVTTLPVFNLDSQAGCGSGGDCTIPLIFPDLADGAGYTSQIVLFNRFSNAVASGNLRFYTQGGDAMPAIIR